VVALWCFFKAINYTAAINLQFAETAYACCAVAHCKQLLACKSGCLKGHDVFLQRSVNVYAWSAAGKRDQQRLNKYLLGTLRKRRPVAQVYWRRARPDSYQCMAMHAGETWSHAVKPDLKEWTHLPSR
jgi:hypothetical protein